jgi:hypothetical protein
LVGRSSVQLIIGKRRATYDLYDLVALDVLLNRNHHRRTAPHAEATRGPVLFANPGVTSAVATLDLDYETYSLSAALAGAGKSMSKSWIVGRVGSRRARR